MPSQPVALVGILFAGCADPDPGTPVDTADTGEASALEARLVWVPGGGDVAWDEAREGLWWALGNLGATPPADEAALVVEDVSDAGVTFRLDLSVAGFPDERLGDVAAALAPVHTWAGDEPVDLGRFLLATLYEPGRYYAITGACATLDGWRAARQVADPALYGITVSQLVEGDRLVALNPASGALETADDVAAAVQGLGWMASEGEGSLSDGTFAASEYETVDVMANGHQRFAVYDVDGALLPAAKETAAGQPGKCMWCHEMTIQRGTSENPGVAGYVDYEGFIEEVVAAERVLAAVRARRESAIDDDYAAHEWAERLTMSFLEPAPERVAREWGVPVEEVEAVGLPTHTNEEFPEWGELYTRGAVDAARAARDEGWAPLDTPPSDRELDADRALAGAEALACSPGVAR